MSQFSQWVNQNQAIILVFTNVLLAIVTTIYVVITKNLHSIAQQQFKIANNPIIGLKVTKIGISKVFGPKRRTLTVEMEMRNLGTGPAIDLQIDGELIYSHTNIKGENRIPMCFEPRKLTYLSVGETLAPNRESNVYWGNDSINYLFDDFRENHRLNIHRIATSSSQEPYKSTMIKIFINYRNNLGQLFESTYEMYIDSKITITGSSTVKGDKNIIEELVIPKDDEEATLDHHRYIRPSFNAKIIDDIVIEKRLKEFEHKRELAGW